MDKEDEIYLKSLIKEYENSYRNMKYDLEMIWKQVIEELVYYRIPNEYDRTFQLRDKFKVELRDGILYAFADTDNMEYYNSKGSISGENVVHWIDVGHNAGDSPFGETDYFWNYPSRSIIENFANRVKAKYPELEIKVFRDTPPIV